MILAQRPPADGGAAVLVAFLVFVLLWPLIRRMVRALGTMFALYGVMLFLPAMAEGVGMRHATGLLVGGMALRTAGSLRRRGRNRRQTPTTSAVGLCRAT